MDLSHKQRRFVAYYLGVSNGNATDAAARAGYGSTRRSAQVLGHRLLSKVVIRAAIAARLESVAMSQDEVLSRLSDIASASLDDFVECKGELVIISVAKGRRRGRLHTLKKLKQGKDGLEIEIKDSHAALVKLGEYHGLWDRPTTPTADIAELLDEADRIAAER